MNTTFIQHIITSIFDKPFLWMPALTSFMVVLLLVPIIIRVAKKFGWVDIPNERKVHLKPMPRLGGIAIFIGLFFSFIIFEGTSLQGPTVYLLAALGVLFLTCLRDDVSELKPFQKMLMQIICASIVFTGGFRITSLEGLGGHHLPVEAQYFLTLLLIVGVTNAYNLIDGIDGLAAGFGFLNALILARLSLQIDQIPIAVLNISLAGALLAFLVYNFPPARIFMGDTGAMIIGFILSVSAIVVWNAATTSGNSHATPWLAGMFIIPVFDTVRIFIRRIYLRRSPFSADKGHVHHLLLETGANQSLTSTILYLANILMVALAIWFSQKHSSIIVIVLLLMTAAFLMELMTVFRRISIRRRFKQEELRMKTYRLENHLVK